MLGSCPIVVVTLPSVGSDSSESAVAVLSTLPKSMSACVIVYCAVNVLLSLAPTARVDNGPPLTFTNGSVIVILVNVILPVFFTVNV